VETQVVTNLQVVTNFTTVIVTNTPAEVTNYATTFVTNVVEVPVPDTNALEMLRLERIAAVKNFNDEHDRAAQLDDEIRRLRQGSSSVGTNLVNVYVTNTTTLVLTNITENPVLVTNVVTNFTEVPVAVTNFAMVIPIIEENTRLKADLAALRSGTSAAAPDAGKTAEELNQSRAQIASLQTALEAVGQEKILLEHKVQELSSMTNSSAENKANYEARIRELTQERDDLIEKLDLLNKQKAGAKNSEVMSQLSALNSEVTVLRSRLAVVEAQPVPYSTDELALFKNTVPQLANPDAGKKSIKEMPSGTAELVASAQGHFAQREYDQAEADYQKILDRDQNNGIALANLATIELQENKLDAAEKHIKAALVQSPDDAYNLSTLGYLKFRQEKFDEALNALSRAAQIDPNNPEIQNYLGVTLSHQGQRKAAEAALRRAIQLAPNYAPAHNNLAVIYLSQTPPLAELARWHYQKAVDAGQPRNPDLEKMLADKGAPVAP
jgi:tetratricopeptide (TPR) repeat protein